MILLDVNLYIDIIDKILINTGIYRKIRVIII